MISRSDIATDDAQQTGPKVLNLGMVRVLSFHRNVECRINQKVTEVRLATLRGCIQMWNKSKRRITHDDNCC